MKRARSAAFTPLHRPHDERPRILPSAPGHRTLKRHKCRAPMPAPDALVALVERVLAAQRVPPADTTPLECEINARVHRLYALTPDEIKLVEEASK